MFEFLDERREAHYLILEANIRCELIKLRFVMVEGWIIIVLSISKPAFDLPSESCYQ